MNGEHVDDVEANTEDPQIQTGPQIPTDQHTDDAPVVTGPQLPEVGADNSDVSGDDWDFDLELQRHPFTAKAPDGVRQRYFVFELNGTQRDDYLTFIAGKTVESNGTRRVKNFKDIQAFLLAKAVYKEGETKPVPLSTIQSWPASMQSKLYDKARDLSGLDKEEGEDDPGND